MIVTPTRELAMQVAKVLTRLRLGWYDRALRRRGLRERDLL